MLYIDDEVDEDKLHLNEDSKDELESDDDILSRQYKSNNVDMFFNSESEDENLISRMPMPMEGNEFKVGDDGVISLYIG